MPETSIPPSYLLLRWSRRALSNLRQCLPIINMYLRPWLPASLRVSSDRLFPFSFIYSVLWSCYLFHFNLVISFYSETRDKCLPVPKALPSLDPTVPSSQASFLKELPTLALFHNSLSLHIVIWLLPSLSMETAVPKSKTCCSCQWTFFSLYLTLPPGENFDHPLFL